jgi:GDSL-like Lipase/Acylhydrolase
MINDAKELADAQQEWITVRALMNWHRSYAVCGGGGAVQIDQSPPGTTPLPPVKHFVKVSTARNEPQQVELCEHNGDGTLLAVAARIRLHGGAMRIVSYKVAALVAVLTLGFIPLNAALGAGWLQVVAFGDSLLDAGTYSLFAEATFGGGRFTTNPGLNFTQDVALHYGDKLTPAFHGGFGLPLVPAGGLNYAQGGSRVRLQPGIDHAPPGTPYADFAEATTIPVADQESTYLWTHGRFTSGQLVLINGGANDVFFQLQTAQQAAVAAIGGLSGSFSIQWLHMRMTLPSIKSVQELKSQDTRSL